MSAPPHHRPSGGFRNPWPTGRLNGLGGFLRWTLLDRFQNRSRPSSESFKPSIVPSAFAAPRAPQDLVTLTWIGHSTFLIQLGGLNILTDPMWSDRASPVAGLGPRRKVAPGVAIDALPPIDIVLVSHDHYDHLDHVTVRRLTRRHPDAMWAAPLGVGRWLRARGAARVAECDWGDRVSAGSAELRCAPAQHFSGRSPFGRDRTLWCGWTVHAAGRAIYFVGDTGYFADVGRIGADSGPFDAILMPIGAYDPRWFMQPVHLAPEEAVRAFVEIRSAEPDRRTVMAGMHFGTFKLTDEPLDEPPKRTRRAWLEAGLPARDLWIPRPGETIACQERAPGQGEVSV